MNLLAAPKMSCNHQGLKETEKPSNQIQNHGVLLVLMQNLFRILRYIWTGMFYCISSWCMSRTSLMMMPMPKTSTGRFYMQICGNPLGGHCTWQEAMSKKVSEACDCDCGMPVPACFLGQICTWQTSQENKDNWAKHITRFSRPILYHQDQIATLHCNSVASDHLLKSCRILLDSWEETEAQLPKFEHAQPPHTDSQWGPHLGERYLKPPHDCKPWKQLARWQNSAWSHPSRIPKAERLSLVVTHTMTEEENEKHSS